MLTLYKATPDGLRPRDEGDTSPIVWADLLNPTREEELTIERMFGAEVPTREEMSEIELSSRLYQERDTYYLTAILLSQADSDQPQTDAITFMLTPNALITLRYSTPKSFSGFLQRCERGTIAPSQPAQVLLALLEAITDRLADILEMVGRNIEGVSRQVFQRDAIEPITSGKPDLQNLLREVGRNGDLISKVQESLVSLVRLGGYIAPSPLLHNAEEAALLQSVQSDLGSLADHGRFLAEKVTFLLDAVLGMISIEQNGIIKIFSVAAVIFLPPTLVASIYGMNFHVMPELSWRFGYPMALGLMLLSAYVPYRFFKKKNWL